MLQALHILRKDIRYLWIEITAALVAVGLFVFTATQSTLSWTSPLPRTVAAFLMQFLLPFAWWTLITRAVHAEPLIGDRQFWPTRPYSWPSLLMAKCLLCVLFVNVPVFLGQAIVIAAHGFSPLREMPGLLWSQVLFTGFVTLPIAAIACVTASVVQFLVLLLVCFAASVLLSMRFSMFAAAIAGIGWGPMDWIQSYYTLMILALAAPAVLVWQYAKRQTTRVRALVVGAVIVLCIGIPISWSTAFALQSRLSPHKFNEAALQIGLNTSFQWMTRALVERNGQVSVHVPLQLSGIGDDVEVQPEGMGVTIQGANGVEWRADAEARRNVSVTGQLISLQTAVSGLFYQQVKDQPVRIRGYLYATLFGNRLVTRLPFTNRAQPVRGMGLCTASTTKDAPYLLSCDSVFRPQTELASVKFEERAPRGSISYLPQREPPSYSPFPATFAIDPVRPYMAYSTYKEPLDAVTITTLQPIAHVRIPLRIDGLKLGEYERKI